MVALGTWRSNTACSATVLNGKTSDCVFVWLAGAGSVTLACPNIYAQVPEWSKGWTANPDFVGSIPILCSTNGGYYVKS